MHGLSAIGWSPAGLVNFRWTTGAGDRVGSVIGVGPVDVGDGVTDEAGAAEDVGTDDDGTGAVVPPPDPDELHALNASAAQHASAANRVGRAPAARIEDVTSACMISSLAPRRTAPGSGLSSRR